VWRSTFPVYHDRFFDSNINNASIVLSLSFGEFGALLMGDAEKEVQIRFLSSVSDVEVLKVAHQGARDGAYEPLLKAVRPELAVISVGAGNSYGHPHQSALDLLRRLGIPVLRTDQSGTVKVVSDGESFWYSTSK
jgi:competence protein ComEC